MFSRLLALISVLALTGPLSVYGQTYLIKDDIVGEGFYSAFTFEAIADPTDGRVYVVSSIFHNLTLRLTMHTRFHSFYRNYTDVETAKHLGLTSATGDSFIMRADDTTVLTADGPGRNSIRISSNAQYSTHVVV